MDSAAVRELGAFLTGTEARQLANHFAAWETLSQALVAVGVSRRAEVRRLLARAGLGPADALVTEAVLRAIEGAHDHATTVTPVWTAPGNLAGYGRLTASIHHYVASATSSVICSTFNFQRSSVLWTALAEVAERPEVDVRIYVDTDAADADPAPWKPTTDEIAAEFRGASVFRTRLLEDGVRARNHAKFVAIDHHYLLVTSANFSRSAERLNVELGLRSDDPILTQAVERQVLELEGAVFERVQQS